MSRSEEKTVFSPLAFSDFAMERTHPLQGGNSREVQKFLPLFSKMEETEKEKEAEGKKELERVREEAKEILEEAKKRADELTEKAYEKAYAEGEKAGYEYGLKKVESIIRALSDADRALKSLHREIIRSQEKEIISLVLHIARKVIKTEAVVNGEVLTSVIRAAVEEVPQKDDLKIKLNPMDYEFINENLKSFFKRHEELKEAVIEPDSNVDVGGVIVDHKMGSVDARLSRQFEKIEAMFQKILEENQKERERKG